MSWGWIAKIKLEATLYLCASIVYGLVKLAILGHAEGSVLGLDIKKPFVSQWQQLSDYAGFPSLLAASTGNG